RVTTRFAGTVSASLTVNEIGPVDSPGFRVRLAMLEMVGGVLTGAGGLTVTTKLVLAVREPSETVRVIVAVPDWPATGFTVTVRLAPLPPSTMFDTGTSAVFDEERLIVRLPAAVCASATVKEIGPV